MDNLKDSIFKGGEGIVKLTVSVSSLFTAFQQLAAHAGFKLPMAALEGLNRPEAGDSTAAVVAPGTIRGALHTSAVAPSLARRPHFGHIPGFVQAQGATSGAQRSRAGDTGPAAGASSSAADQAGAAACVTTAAAGQPGAYAGAPPAGAVQPGSSAGALPAGARLPGAAADVSPAAAGQPGAMAIIPTAVAGHPSAEADVSTAAAGQPVAARPCATAGAPKAAAGQHGPATEVAINAGVVRPGDVCWDILGLGSDLTNFPPCVQVQDATGSQAADDAPRTAVLHTSSAAWTSGEQLFVPSSFPPGMHLQGFRAPGAGVFAPQASGVQPGASAHVAPAGPSGHTLHRPNLLVHGPGYPTTSVHLPLLSHGPSVQEPPAFLFAAEALDTGSILPGRTSSAPRGTLLNMPSQQVLPSPAASSSFMPSTQVFLHVPNILLVHPFLVILTWYRAALSAPAPTATAAPAYCATMASLPVLAFDHEGRPVQFDTWLDDLQLYLLSDSKDSVSLFDLATGAATAPPATADSATRSQWLTHDAAVCLAICNHLPLAECTHFGQHRTAQALYDAVVARYSSPATAALGRLLLPYLFPELFAFATVEDLVSHLRASDACYRTAAPAEFLDKNQPPMFITLYFIVTRLFDSLRSVRDHFLSLDPTSLTVDLLKQHLLAAETSAVVVEDVGATSASVKRRNSKGKGGKGGGGGSGSGGGGSGSSGGGSSGGGGGGGTGGGSGGSGGGGGGSGGSGGSGGGGTGGARRVGLGGGQRQQQQRRSETQSSQHLREWFLQRAASGGSIATRMSFARVFVLVRHARSFTLSIAASPALTTLGVLSLVTTSSSLAGQICFGLGLLSLTWLGGALSVCTCRSTHADPVFLSLVYRGLCLPCRPHLPRPAFLASRGGSAPLLTPPRFPRRLLPCRLSTWTKGQVSDVLIPWIRTVRLQLRERFGQDLPVLRLHSDRGGEFSSNLLWDFCCGEGILQSFTLLDSPQKNGIVERCIGLVMEVARTSMIHAAAPHFLWPFAVRYAAHQLNLWPRVSLPETSPTLRWTGQVGDASVFRGPAPSGVSQVDPLPSTAPVQVAVDLGAAQGAVSGGPASGGAESEGAGSGCAEPRGDELGGAEPAGVETGGVQLGGAELEGAESGGAASSGGPAGALPRLSPQQLREWFVRRARLWSGTTGAGGVGGAEAGGARVTAGAGVTGCTAAASPGGARTRGAGAAGTGGVGGARAGDPTEPGAARAGGSCAGGAGAGGAGAGGAGVGGTGAGGAGARGAGAVDPGAGGAGGTMRPRPYFVQLLQQSSGLTDRREPASCSFSPVRTTCRVPHLGPPPVPGTHAMAIRPSFVPLRVPLPAPTDSSLPDVPDPESDRALAASPTDSRLLATAIIGPSFESAAASALVAKLLDCALGTDVLEDRQVDFEYLVATVPRFASMLLVPEGDPDAPDITTPRSCAEAITGPYSSKWQAAMDADMASWKSTGTYVEEVPPPGANIVDGMWIFRVKRPPGSPPALKARYIARGFRQRQGVDYFQTFSRTPKMTTLWVLLHIAAQRDYELHSLDFSTAFLLGSLHEEIWLRRPPSFTGTFPVGTQQSLRRPVYGLRQAPREWHDTLRTTLCALGFTPSTVDPSLFLRIDTSLPPFYVLVYVDDLVFATANTEALTLVKSELQKRHTFTDLGELRSYLGLQITRDRARRTITLTQSHIVHQILQRFSFQFSSPQPSPLSTTRSQLHLRTSP
ncbi:unnamed protein product [Closterium sp. NIES-54]